MIRHLRLAKNNFQKIQKLKYYPLKPPKTKNQRECSSELLLKTINVQTHWVSKQKNSKISKTKQLPPKTPKNERWIALMN